MNTIERFRPQAHPLDAEWSAATLESILATSHNSRPLAAKRRRRLALVGGTAAGILGVGGVAYAAGLIPALVTEDMDSVSPSTVSNVHEVASFTLKRDGTTRTFEIYSGNNEAGEICTTTLEAGSRFGPNISGQCANVPAEAWYTFTSEVSKIDEAAPDPTYYVYGEPNVPGVAIVRVFGEGFDHTVAVEEKTGGYAVPIPELTHEDVSGRFATVEFLDANGTVIGTSALSEM